jgi:hypothetical protein
MLARDVALHVPANMLHSTPIKQILLQRALFPGLSCLRCMALCQLKSKQRCQIAAQGFHRGCSTGETLHSFVRERDPKASDLGRCCGILTQSASGSYAPRVQRLAAQSKQPLPGESKCFDPSAALIFFSGFLVLLLIC